MTTFDESRDIIVLRGLAATAQQLVAAATAAVLTVDLEHDGDGAVAAYAPGAERLLEGGIRKGPARHPITNFVRELLYGNGTLVDDISSLSGYMPLWSEESMVARGALVAVPVRDKNSTPIGAIIARRVMPFSRDDIEHLRCLEEVACAAIETAFPLVVCGRCLQLADVELSLVAFVGSEWVYGHKHCYTDEETRTWFELNHVREEPLYYTRAATTDRTEPEHLTTFAVTSWYRIMNELLGWRGLIVLEDDEAEPIHAFSVR